MSVLRAAVTLANRLGASYRTELNMKAQTQVTLCAQESAISSVSRGQWIMLRNINEVHGNSKEKFDFNVFATEDKYKTEKKKFKHSFKKSVKTNYSIIHHFSSLTFPNDTVSCLVDANRRMITG